MAIPLLDSLDLKNKDITADALLTQRKLADYLVLKRQAHYHFTVKANQSTLLDDLTLFFQDRQAPHFVTHDSPDHGRIETRKIWTTTALNSYLDFPHVEQAFAIREQFEVRIGRGGDFLAFLPAFFFAYHNLRGHSATLRYAGIELETVNAPCVKDVSYLNEFRKTDVLFDFFVPEDPAALRTSDLFKRVYVPGFRSI